MTLVIDASAAVEYLLRTQLGERVALLIGGALVTAPELLDGEVLSVLRREVLRGALSARRAEEAIEDLSVWGLLRLAHQPLLLQAWALRENVSAYDARYVAAARVLDASLVTADGPLARASNLGDARLG